MTTAPTHIVVVTRENENFSDIVGNTAEAPFLNQLISEGMLFTNDYGLAYPSQPNYLALFSSSTQGVTGNIVPSQFPASVPTLASTITDPFSGISDPTNTPPENAFAVGPDYIFMAETTHYEITDLSGNPIVANGSLYSLFSPLGSTLDNSLLDARAAYDSSTGRFVIVVDNFQPGTGNFGANIDIAVSKDSNPADGWYLASIDTSNGFTTQSDMPYLSVSNGNIYVSTPEYLDAGGGYSTAEFVVGESDVIAAGNAAITPAASNIASASGGIMRNVAGDNGTTYYLGAYSDGSQTALTYQTYSATNGFSATQTLYLGDADVGGGGSDYTAAQMGTTEVLDIGDSRIQSLAYSSSGGHDYVYGVSEVMPSAGSAAEIEWFQLDVTNPANPQYVNGNVISGASLGANVAVFNPSIAVDANGDVLINFSASGPDMYPSDYYTVLGAGDSAFSAPTLYEASNTFFNSGSLNDQRWGTYSTAVADPNNANGFWFSNEYVTTAVNGPGGSPGWWSTIAAQVQVGAVVAPPVFSAAANTVDYDEGGAPVAVDAGLTVSDAGSTTLDSATIAISVGLLAGDTLAFTAQSGITGSYSASTGVLTLSGNASLAAYQAALDSVVYSSSSADATNGGADMTRTITWTATSAGTTSLPVTSVVDIVPPPPPPGTASVTALFSGLSDPTNYPPENGLAVGPGNVVMAETTKYEITNLAGGAATTGSLYTLFTSLGSTLDNSVLDARIAYDSSTGRYVLIAENFQPGGGNFKTNIDIAVSKDSNPADGWYVASIDTSNNGTSQSDMPYLSVGGGNIDLTNPEYLDSGGFGGAGEWILSESSVVAGSPNTVANLAPAADYIMRNVAGANGVSYYLAAHSTGSQTNLYYQTYSASRGFSAVQTIALGNSDLGPGTSDFTVQQAGTSLTLDAGNSRIESLTYANGYLWGVSEVMPSGATTPEIHWFKLNVANPASPTVAAQGDISGASIGSGVGVFNASIAVDGNGDVLINFTASGSSLDPSDYYVTMGAGASIFSAPTLYQSSASYFQQTSGATGAQRWGTYSSAIADPNNANAFWISNEYVTKTGVTIPTGLTAWWSTVTAQVTVSSSSPPALGGGGVAATYTEGGSSATLNSGLTVSDPSSATLSGATVSIASGLLAGDTLGFVNQNGISGVYNSTTGVLTLSGSASLAAYQTALDSVSFSSTSLNPTNYGADLTRAINWQVSAGAQQSSVVSSSVNVVGVDQAPVLSGAGNTTTYTAGGAAVAIDNSLAVSDPDNLDLASSTVTISGNFQSGDQLNFTNQNGISGSYNSATGVLTLTGAASVGQYQTALDSVTFSTSSLNAASRTVSWQVYDGTLNSAAATSTVNIVAPPTLGGGGVAATYTEGGSSATLNSGLTVSDPSGATLSGATVSIASGLLAGDTLGFVNQNGISGVYNSTTGVLTLSGSASLAAYQTALDSVTFSSTSLNPTNYGADLTRAINWQVSAGAQQSSVVSSSVNVVGVDQAPVLSGAGNTTTYTAGGAAVAIDNSLAVSDPDNLDLASATVTISNNLQSGDQLIFTNRNGITGAYNAATGVLTLNGPATLAQYQTALDSVTFSTTSTNTGSRAVSWQVYDGTLLSAIVASTVAIAAQAPTLASGGYLANWAQAVPPATTSTSVAADPTLTIADASSLTLSNAKIAITTGLQSGDQLVFVNQNGVTGSYNASTGVLTLSGTASPATYQAALDSIVFTSTNANPTSNGSDSARTLTWTATAGTLTSAAVTSTIDLGQTYKLTSSKDTISAGVGADTIVAATPSTINSTDSINGGGGSNTLLLQGAGSFNLGTPKTLSNIENVTAPGVAGGTTSVTLRKGLNNLAIGVGSGVLNETFNVNASGSTGDTFLLTPDFGALTISNFAATGSGHDILEFQASMFSYLTPGMTQAAEAMAILGYAAPSGANTVITDSLGDKITLNSVSIATLNANLADFKFV